MKLDIKKLRTSLHKSGFTQTDIAKITGLSYSQVNHVFRGISCGERSAVIIAQALGVPLYELEEESAILNDIDIEKIADAVIERINEKTKETGKSQLVI